MDLPSTCLKRFGAAVAELEAQARRPFDWFVPAWRLNVAARGGDSIRIARHLHQMCIAHAGNFRWANYVKLAYLGRFYVTEADARNPLGLASAARAILEAHVFLRYVQSGLANLCSDRELTWQARGERFFEQVLRARIATKDPAARDIASKLGISKDLIRPFRVKECIDSVAAAHDEFSWMSAHYAYLCDLVHANQLSQLVATAGYRSDVGISDVSGGAVLFEGTGPIVQYMYGSAEVFEAVLRSSCAQAFAALRDATAAIKETPESPYSEAELMTLTGHSLGLKPLDVETPCPCGSGQTYKACHGMR